MAKKAKTRVAPMSTQTRNEVVAEYLSLEVVKDYLRVDFTDDDIMIQLMIDASIGYLERYTKEPLEVLVTYPEIKMAALLIIAQYYENRSINITAKGIDEVLRQTLSMNSLMMGEIYLG